MNDGPRITTRSRRTFDVRPVPVEVSCFAPKYVLGPQDLLARGISSMGVISIVSPTRTSFHAQAVATTVSPIRLLITGESLVIFS